MNFRELKTKSDKSLLLGKDAKQNEALVKQFMGKENIILHTAAPGSPFCVIREQARKKDIKEAAVACAIYSQDWRDNKGDVRIHVFTGKDVYKEKGMKTGTFGVKKFKVIKVKKRRIEGFGERFKKTPSDLNY